MTKSLSVLSLLFVAWNAHAVGVSLTKPVKSEISERATNVFFQKEQAYDCALEGSLEDGWSWSNSVSVKVTARNLQDAAELAFTPFIVEEPKAGDQTVKIKVDGANYMVKTVNCKPVQQSI